MPIHCLRYDDLCAHSDCALEERLIELFLRNRVPCTFGVVPFACDPASLLAAGEIELNPLTDIKVNLLKPLLAAGLAEVALHGYSHLALAPIRGHHEFSSRMPKETQRRLLQRGRAHLEDCFGLKIRLFIPPWNNISPVTIEVLQEEGLLLSAGFMNQDPVISQYPCTVSAAETAGALRAARRWGGKSAGVGTLLHDYDFRESGLGTSTLTLPEFENMIQDWKKGKDVRFRLVSEVLQDNPAGQSARDQGNFRLRSVMNRSRLGRRLFRSAHLVYWEAGTAARLAAIMGCLP
jgi:peptidoglycan/xylan/chitin deacetylase (PgdA/CDA1 family)